MDRFASQVRSRLGVERLETRDVPATINVTSLADTVAVDGAVTLREAIQSINGAANVNADVTATGYGTADTITFTGLSGTITLANTLDFITKSVSILGNTGNGFTNAPVITIDGNNKGTFVVRAANTTIRSLSIVDSASNGIAIENVAGAVVAGNYIGVRADGVTAEANRGTGVLISSGSTNSTIGGTTAADRNVISGNTGNAVAMQNAGTSNNVVRGNYIGTNAAGTAAVGNAFGVVIQGTTNNTIAGNVISGNGTGIFFGTAGTTGNVISGNLIGTNAAGTAALGNTFGISFAAGAAGNTIGGTAAGTRNVISGNSSQGVTISGAGASNNVIQGNYIGTDVSGTAALANATFGVTIFGGATNNTVGGTTAAARNVISGNGNAGVQLFGVGTSGNLVQGNYLGTDASGAAALGNTFGVAIQNGATNNTVGGTAAGAGNVIAFNLRGVIVQSAAGVAAPTGNAILGNSIFSNSSLGIDLGLDGVTANDSGDADTGANNLQNYPSITSVVANQVSGQLTGAPNTTYRIELFTNDVSDASSFGEGRTFLMALNVTTDANGVATFSATIPGGNLITATATNLTTNDTSEFSSAVLNRATQPVIPPSNQTSPPATNPPALPQQTPQTPVPVVNTPVVPAGVTPTVTAGQIAPTAGAAGARNAKGVVVVAQGPGGTGAVDIFNADGTLRSSFAAFPGFLGGVRAATADVNHDGIPDVIVGAGVGATGGHVKVFSGADGSLLRSFLAFDGYLGDVYVAGGDVNADGFADIIVGSGVNGRGHVKVFDGQTGTLLTSFFAYSGYTGGVTVAAGDFNNDGLDDVVVGTAELATHVKVIEATSLRRVNTDGTIGDAALLSSFFAYAGFGGGVFVSTGDFNNDGIAELVTGAGAGGNPHVKVFNGTGISNPDSAMAASFLAFDAAFRGGVRVNVADTNQDGNDELVIGSGLGTGTLQVRSGVGFANVTNSLPYPGFAGGIFVG